MRSYSFPPNVNLIYSCISIISIYSVLLNMKYLLGIFGLYISLDIITIPVYVSYTFTAGVLKTQISFLLMLKTFACPGTWQNWVGNEASFFPRFLVSKLHPIYLVRIPLWSSQWPFHYFVLKTELSWVSSTLPSTLW